METAKRSTSWIWLAGLLLLTPALYLAGLGPVAWLETHALDDPDMRLWEVYALPATWLSEIIPAAKGPMEWYIDLWD